MLRLYLRSMLCLLLALGLLVAAAGGEEVDVTGATGVDGSDGADGDPGEPGTDGGDGQDAVAIADAPGESNTATATGGRGGAGGGGGDGVPAGADAGAGGNGGNGGAARAEAIVVGALRAVATASGGLGGTPGLGGNPDAPDGATGESGTAEALATAEASSAGVSSGDAVRAQATSRSAPQGFVAPGSVAGATNSTARAENSGAGPADAQAVAESFSVFDAVTERTGDASATAFGSNAGDTPVNVRASAASGLPAGATIISPPRLFEEVGAAEAQAEGVSTGGGIVDVLAEIGVGNAPDRPSAELVNAVSGSTAGRLSLRQSTAAASGEARTALQATNPGGGDLAVSVSAVAGEGRVRGLDGSADSGEGQDAVLGDILATSVDGTDVDLEVVAQGGKGAWNPAVSDEPSRGGTVVQQKLDGSGDPSRIHAESNGGDVSVMVQFLAGPGGDGANGSDGTSMRMENVARGDTTGRLVLEQRADGGFGGAGFELLAPPDTERAGDGGDAHSVLSKESASSSLAVRSEALAGDGGSLLQGPEGATAGVGGEAVAEARAVNAAGSASAEVRAIGGTGGRASSEGTAFGRGGDASGEASARTLGDGHAVVVGAAEESGVWGGAAGSFRIPGTLPGADGGDAVSRSTGIAEGDSTVAVIDRATGGRGGGASLPQGAPGVGGDGGSASSMATALGSGTSTVTASALAEGGMGGSLVTELGVAGDAEADASATGLGQVEASAQALGGGYRVRAPFLRFGERGGSGAAQASATGATGFARGEAITGEGAQQRYRALSQATLGSDASDVWARATFGEALGGVLPATGREGQSFLTGDPLEEDVAAALDGNSALAERFATEPSRMAALGQWGARNEGDEELVVTSELDVLLREAVASTLAIGAYGFESEGEGFTTLAFRVESFGAVLDEELFTDLDEALAFFEDQLFEVDDAFGDDAEAPPLRLVFVATLARGDAFGMDLGFVVPEPSTAPLLALGLLVLASRRRRRSERRFSRIH